MLRSFLLTIFLSVVCLAMGASHSKPLRLRAEIDSGVVVYLSDGSAWEVRVGNRAKVSAWTTGSPIGVYRTSDRDFLYRLILRPGDAGGGDCELEAVDSSSVAYWQRTTV